MQYTTVILTDLSLSHTGILTDLSLSLTGILTLTLPFTLLMTMRIFRCNIRIPLGGVKVYNEHAILSKYHTSLGPLLGRKYMAVIFTMCCLYVINQCH